MNSTRVQLLRLLEALHETRNGVRHVTVNLRYFAADRPPGEERAHLNLEVRRLAEIDRRVSGAAAALEWTLRFLPSFPPR